MYDSLILKRGGRQISASINPNFFVPFHTFDVSWPELENATVVCRSHLRDESVTTLLVTIKTLLLSLDSDETIAKKKRRWL